MAPIQAVALIPLLVPVADLVAESSAPRTRMGSRRRGGRAGGWAARPRARRTGSTRPTRPASRRTECRAAAARRASPRDPSRTLDPYGRARRSRAPTALLTSRRSCCMRSPAHRQCRSFARSLDHGARQQQQQQRTRCRSRSRSAPAPSRTRSSCTPDGPLAPTPTMPSSTGQPRVGAMSACARSHTHGAVEVGLGAALAGHEAAHEPEPALRLLRLNLQLHVRCLDHCAPTIRSPSDARPRESVGAQPRTDEVEVQLAPVLDGGARPRPIGLGHLVIDDRGSRRSRRGNVW